MTIRTFLLATTLATLTCGSAHASGLVFQGQNAALFPGANPNDTALLMNSVPKPAKDPNAQTSSTATTLIQSAVESQISAKIYNDIFGTGAATAGSEVLGDGSIISWVPDPGSPGHPKVTITYSDGSSVVVYGSAP